VAQSTKRFHLLGDPGTTIAAYAKQEKIALVVMGSHGQGALPGIVLGSVACKVLAHCETPALIIR
jgi:nucleotide-binding universal stress UspA family protein